MRHKDASCVIKKVVLRHQLAVLAGAPSNGSDLKCLVESPPPALALGLAGAIPFVTGELVI